jgi:predicted transcriptional regulator
MKTASFRLDESEDAEIEALAKRLKTDRSSIARRAIGMGIKELKRREALEMVRRHEWTVWRAASYCEQSYRAFLRFLRFENVPFPLTAEEVGRELDDSRSE